MPNPGFDIDDARLIEAVRLVREHGTVAAAARAAGLTDRSMRHRYARARDLGLVNGGTAPPEVPVFPEDDVPARVLLDQHEAQFERQQKFREAVRWFPIRVRSMEPMGLAFVGDPHLGSAGCNVRLLRHHADLLARTPGLYAVNMGDTADNWNGKLVRLYAENPTTRARERTLARWLLEEAGIKWLAWIMGNHDEMEPAFLVYLKTINASLVPMLDWRAQFRLCFPDGTEFKVDAAHNHKGHSMWNPLHGQVRASRMDAEADLYIAGHHHTWAIQSGEREGADGKSRVYHLARARGYKYVDTYADKHQFHNHQFGATITIVIDPTAVDPTRSKIFYDLDEAVDYLSYRRAKAGV